jgi:putative peptidoglycan lipid II flippase
MNAALLYRGLRRAGIYQPMPGWRVFLLKLVVALAAMGMALWFASGPASWWLHAAPAARGVSLAGVVILGAAVYFLALWLLGFRPRDFSRKMV